MKVWLQTCRQKKYTTRQTRDGTVLYLLIISGGCEITAAQ